MTQTKPPAIGLKQARQICNMEPDRRLRFIAEGLPIIFASAQSLMDAATALTIFPRETEILYGHAEEECAKILILADIVRCPPKRVASRLGPMLGWFYDHLARLIYAKAQRWSAPSVADLQTYVDHDRPSHYLEGDYGEFIAPNWELFGRESTLYADVVGNEDADPTWNSPAGFWNSPLGELTMDGRAIPAAFRIADAMNAFGLFTVDGLKILQKVWGRIEFIDMQGYEETCKLSNDLVDELSSAGLISEQATDEQARTLLHHWQMPMYSIDFSPIAVSLEELQHRRERNFPIEYCLGAFGFAEPGSRRCAPGAA